MRRREGGGVGEVRREREVGEEGEGGGVGEVVSIDCVES